LKGLLTSHYAKLLVNEPIKKFKKLFRLQASEEDAQLLLLNPNVSLLQLETSDLKIANYRVPIMLVMIT
jgi:hypothetical protein